MVPWQSIPMSNDYSLESVSDFMFASPCPSTAGLCVPAELCQHHLGQERPTGLLPPCSHSCLSYPSNNLDCPCRSRPSKESFPWITVPKDTTALCTTLRFSDFIQCWNAGEGFIWEVQMTAAIFHSSLTRHMYTGSPKCHLTCWLHLSHLLALKAPFSITAFQSSSY